MRFWKWLLAALSLAGAVQVHARALVPLVDFKDIPVQAAPGVTLTAEQVKLAISSAAAAEQWSVVQVSPGLLRATINMKQKHLMVIDIPYSAEKYSLNYYGSENLKASVVPMSTDTRSRPSDGMVGAPNFPGDSGAAAKHEQRLNLSPQTKYAVARPDLVIHPSYEIWVARLGASIARQLQSMQP